MTDFVDAHHHLWDLRAVDYPWLMAKGVERFFGDPTPIQRDYLMREFCAEARAQGFGASVHIQVGAADGLTEARWVQSVAEANPGWPLAQVVFCDLTAPGLSARLDAYQKLPTVRGVRQIVGRSAGEDARTGTNALLENPRFVAGLREVGKRGLTFDLQLIPELMRDTARALESAPDTYVALCHAGSPHNRSAAGLKTWTQQLKDLSALPQVVCKLSGLGMFDHDWGTSSIRPIVETCLDQFGPERVMFGSNFPVDKLYSDYSTLAAAYRTLIPPQMQAAVFGATARKYYHLETELG
jgi:predicted TIM-barrel fold metal-dependent hydrolase